MAISLEHFCNSNLLSSVYLRLLLSASAVVFCTPWSCRKKLTWRATDESHVFSCLKVCTQHMSAFHLLRYAPLVAVHLYKFLFFAPLISKLQHLSSSALFYYNSDKLSPIFLTSVHSVICPTKPAYWFATHKVTSTLSHKDLLHSRPTATFPTLISH